MGGATELSFARVFNSCHKYFPQRFGGQLEPTLRPGSGEVIVASKKEGELWARGAGTVERGWEGC